MGRYSVELLETKLDGSIDRLLGTDGTLNLDGRFRSRRADYEAMEYFLKIRTIKPYLVGYRLLRNGNKVRDFIFKD